METEKDIVIKYSSYTPAQKKANEKYREINKDKINDQRKKYYQVRKEKDPDFLTYKRQKAKEYYIRKKNNKAVIKEPVIEVVKEPSIEVVKVIEQELIKEPIVKTKKVDKPKENKK